jgi:MoxR-like ATPase
MNPNHNQKFESVERIQEGFVGAGYVCSRQIATTLYVAYHLEKPILIEGPAGVGKTELGKITAAYLELPLIRLQCYEGLDDSKALYEWKYGKQLLYTQILKDRLNGILKDTEGLAGAMAKLHAQDDIFFSTHFLEPRPLLKALQKKEGSVLLVDEVDKSDEEFEAFLLEILSDFQITIPEIGTIEAESKPLVFLTSNNSREICEPLKRRCLHLYIPLPTAQLERQILQVHVPDLSESLRIQLVSFVQQVRELDLKKLPSISETIDWARVMLLHHSTVLDREMIRDTLNTFLKFEEDIELVNEHLYEMQRKAKKEAVG